MKKTLLVFGAILLFGLAAIAQDDEYPKFELSGTASALIYDIDTLGDETMWGWGIGGQYNVNKFFGIVGEWNAAHGESGPVELNDGEDVIQKLDTRIRTLLFGPRFSVRTKAVTVFGHFLVGAGTTKIDDDLGAYNFDSVTSWQVAYAIGGGLDINMGKHFALRPAQFDYVFIDSDLKEITGNSAAPGAWNNFRYQLGGVIKF